MFYPSQHVNQFSVDLTISTWARDILQYLDHYTLHSFHNLRCFIIYVRHVIQVSNWSVVEEDDPC